MLSYNQVKLKYGRTLRSYGIQEGNMIEAIERVKVGCFSKNTLITLADGKKKKISDISKDDIVLSYDEVEGRWK